MAIGWLLGYSTTLFHLERW